MNAMVLTYTLNRLFAMKNTEIVDTLMNQVFALFPEDLSKYWIKLQQFLQFLFELTKSGYDQASYMIKNNLISKLIDLFLENESPKAFGKKRQPMGSNYANPPFENLIQLIGGLVRSYPFIDFGDSVAQEGDFSSQYLKSF